MDCGFGDLALHGRGREGIGFDGGAVGLGRDRPDGRKDQSGHVKTGATDASFGDEGFLAEDREAARATCPAEFTVL